jgi:hypothetical protein
MAAAASIAKACWPSELTREVHKMVIGFRCSPQGIALVALKGTKGNPILVTSEVVSRPANLTDPAFFSWVHKEIRDLLTTNSPKRISFKKAEHAPSRSSSTERRAQVEAILQVAAYDAGYKQVAGMTKSQIAAAIGYEGTIKEVIVALDGTPLEDFKKDERGEAALVAWSIL